MKRTLAVLALASAALLMWWLGWRRARPTDVRDRDAVARAPTAHEAQPNGDDHPGLGDRARERGLDAATPAANLVPDHAVRDRALRDRIRERIFAMWSASAMPGVGTSANAPRPDPLHTPMPERDGGGVDPGYLRERIREDFMPLASACYDSFLTRRPRVGGTLRVRFTIIGDPSAGGVVDEAQFVDDIDAGPLFGDDELRTCMRESLVTVAFRPPPHGGTLTVTYPFRMSPPAPDGA